MFALALRYDGCWKTSFHVTPGTFLVCVCVLMEKQVITATSFSVLVKELRPHTCQQVLYLQVIPSPNTAS